jgi:NitT/TauT family transport system ATP-binding protein
MRTLKTREGARPQRSVPASSAGQSAVPAGTAAQAGGDVVARAAGYGSVIQAQDLSFSYASGSKLILDSLDLDVKEGEIVVFIGPSGCGKSTVLGLIAGMLQPTSGSLECKGSPVKGLNRNVSYMTQKDTLLPWRNALDNAALPLEIKGMGKKERYERARQALASVGLEDAEHLRPHQLSGGMRARLSLARSLLGETDILLMDEPFAAVDALSRMRLQQLLVSLWDATRKTIIYVTHDLDEAINLGHRVVVMGRNQGIHHEEPIPAPQPRDIAAYKSTPEARDLYATLWNSLESQMKK